MERLNDSRAYPHGSGGALLSRSFCTVEVFEHDTGLIRKHEMIYFNQEADRSLLQRTMIF